MDTGDAKYFAMSAGLDENDAKELVDKTVASLMNVVEGHVFRLQFEEDEGTLIRFSDPTGDLRALYVAKAKFHELGDPLILEVSIGH